VNCLHSVTRTDTLCVSPRPPPPSNSCEKVLVGTDIDSEIPAQILEHVAEGCNNLNRVVVRPLDINIAVVV
jgi:hypothetical protein